MQVGGAGLSQVGFSANFDNPVRCVTYIQYIYIYIQIWYDSPFSVYLPMLTLVKTERLKLGPSGHVRTMSVFFESCNESGKVHTISQAINFGQTI